MREDQHGSRTLHTKTAKQRYKCIANFHFIVDAFVKFPGCSKYNGFLINVHRRWCGNVSMQNCCALRVLLFINKRMPGIECYSFLAKFFGFKTDIAIAIF